MTKEDKDTRYYVHIELRSHKVVSWDYGHKEKLSQQSIPETEHRVYLTRGQYNKLIAKLG
jgi:hypothetical protein